MGITNAEFKLAFSSTNNKSRNEEKENKISTSLNINNFSFTILIFFVFWHLFPKAWIFKWLFSANLLIYYSWGLIYFDSLRCAVDHPFSPLSPVCNRMKLGHNFYFNYIFIAVIGVFLSLFICWYH